ncbi:MAG: hypothetical protein M0T74_13700 [Desulfitobacterium hafniense]|nr:hypothetical protein [Desulfitobacterium hafniense]
MITISVIRNILVRVGADIRPLQNNMAQAQRSMGGFGANMRGVQANVRTSMSSIAGSMAIARTAFVALGAAAVVASSIVGKNAIKAAMDVVESESLFTVSMGNMASAARAWSEELQASLGLNAYEVRRNVGVFYNMTTSMGLARAAAYKLSTDLTKLAYDMSSFYNMPVEEMFVKLQSGITGETEPLKRIGILVLDSTIKQYAYAEGIANVGAELTEQQKVMARYIAIMGQTKNAQGDLARTIMSPTNQLRILGMQLQLAKVNLGNAFLPIVNIVLPVLTNFAKSLVRVTNTFAQFMRALFGQNNAQTQNAQSAADAADAQTKLGNATKKAGAAAKKGVAGFDEIHQLQEDMAATAEDAADAMGGSPTTPVPEKEDSTSIIPQGIIDAANKAKIALKPVSDAFDKFKESLRNLGKAISENPQIQAWFERTKTQFENIKTGAILALAGALETLAGVINIAAGALSGNFETALKGMEQVAGGSWDILTGIMYPFFPEIAKKMQEFKKDFGEKWASLKTDVKEYGDPTKLEASDFGNYIRDKVSEKWEELRVKTATKWAEIKTTLSEKWEDIKAITWDDVKNVVLGHWSTLKTSSATKWDEIKVTLSEKWEDIKTGIGWEDIKNNVVTIWNDLKIKTGTIWDEIGKSIKNSVNFVIETINSFIRGVNNIKITIPVVKNPLTGSVIGGGGPINFPYINEITPLAKGGEIVKPTLAVMGEQNRKEVVLPLEDSSVWDKMASVVGTAMLSVNQFQQSNQPQQSQEANFYLDGDRFARAIIPLIRKEYQRTGNIAIT